MNRSILLIPAVLTAVVLTACGGGGSVQNGTGSTRANAFVGLARCMRANGVPSFPDPGGAQGGGGIKIADGPAAGPGATITVNGVTVSGPAFRHAMTVCRGHLPNGGHPSAQQLAQLRRTALAMSRCMRAHGVPNFPDPNFGTGAGGRIDLGVGQGLSSAVVNSPAFQAAQKVCMKGKLGIAVSASGAKGSG